MIQKGVVSETYLLGHNFLCLREIFFLFLFFLVLRLLFFWFPVMRFRFFTKTSLTKKSQSRDFVSIALGYKCPAATLHFITYTHCLFLLVDSHFVKVGQIEE